MVLTLHYENDALYMSEAFNSLFNRKIRFLERIIAKVLIFAAHSRR